MSIKVTVLDEETNAFQFCVGEECIAVRCKEVGLFEPLCIEKQTRDGDWEPHTLSYSELTAHIRQEIRSELNVCKTSETREEGSLSIWVAYMLPDRLSFTLSEKRDTIYLLDDLTSYLAVCVVQTRDGRPRLFFFDRRYQDTLFRRIKHTLCGSKPQWRQSDYSMRSQWWNQESVFIQQVEDRGLHLRYIIHPNAGLEDVCMLKLEEPVEQAKELARKKLEKPPKPLCKFDEVKHNFRNVVWHRAVRQWLQAECNADLIIQNNFYCIRRVE